jgi:hypothetical protein
VQRHDQARLARVLLELAAQALSAEPGRRIELGASVGF